MLSRIGRACVVVLVSGLALSLPAHAKTVQEFEAMRPAEKSAFITGFLDKMTGDLGRENPELGQQIQDFFVREQPGKPFSEGLEKLEVELTVLDLKAKQGRVDLSKVQMEGVIVYVTKQHFDKTTPK